MTENDFYATCQIGDAPWSRRDENDEACLAHAQSVYCTRPKGHPGRHVAETLTEVVTFWGER
jgi:hypothetical protein